jgi:hypothetical protein
MRKALPRRPRHGDRVVITRETLLALGACNRDPERSGVAHFDRVFPEGIDVMWTEQHTEWARAQFRYYRWLLEMRLIPLEVNQLWLTISNTT